MAAECAKLRTLGEYGLRGERMRQLQITSWCHEMIRLWVPEGGVYVDATMGNGNDTLLLCKLAGKEGRVP